MKDSIRVFKLSSGESVVGSVLNNNELYDFSSAIQISYPLEMVTTGSNLNLSPWIHPIMTEALDELTDPNNPNHTIH